MGNNILTRGASGYSSLLGNLSVCLCVYVSLDRQAEPLPQLDDCMCSGSFKTLQYQNIWASYDTLEKTIIQRYAGKASVMKKGLQTLRPSHRAMSARGPLKNYHSKICRKSFSQEKRLANTSSIASRHVCPRFSATYNSRQAIYVQLHIAQCHMEFENLIVPILTSLLELKSEGLSI